MLTYQDFLFENELNEAYFNLFKAYCLNENENEFIQLFELNDFSILLNEESVLNKIKNKLEAAKNVVKEKGKNALTATQEKILQIGGNIKKIISEVISKTRTYLSEFIKTQFNNAKSIVSTIKDDILNKAKNADKNKLKEEVVHFKTMSKAFLSWVSTKYTSQVELAAVKGAAIDINESFELFESDDKTNLPYVSNLLHMAKKVPPYNALNKIEKGAEKISGAALNKTSYWISELTGAKFIEYSIIPGLIGLAVGYKIEHLAKHGILHLFPGIGHIVSIISSIAIGIAIVEAISMILSIKDDE